MQDTSGIENFDVIVHSGNYSVETKLVINNTDYLEGYKADVHESEPHGWECCCW